MQKKSEQKESDSILLNKLKKIFSSTIQEISEPYQPNSLKLAAQG